MVQGEHSCSVELQQPGERVDHRGQTSGLSQQDAPSLDADVSTESLGLVHLSDRLGPHDAAGEAVTPLTEDAIAAAVEQVMGERR